MVDPSCPLQSLELTHKAEELHGLGRLQSHNYDGEEQESLKEKRRGGDRGDYGGGGELDTGTASRRFELLLCKAAESHGSRVTGFFPEKVPWSNNPSYFFFSSSC